MSDDKLPLMDFAELHLVWVAQSSSAHARSRRGADGATGRIKPTFALTIPRTLEMFATISVPSEDEIVTTERKRIDQCRICAMRQIDCANFAYCGKAARRG
jgi:hypothetical protein